MKLTMLTALSLSACIVSAEICAYTPQGWESFYSADTACKRSFSSEAWATGKFTYYSSAKVGKRYECCGITEVWSECKWSYCAGLLISGQTTCNSYGSDWIYNGNTGQYNCNFLTSQVKCCKRVKV
jgi:hypothetical protein